MLCDGDKSGKKTYKAIKALCEAHSLSSIILADAAVIEDYALDRGCLRKAACETIRTAAQSLSIALPSDVEQQVEQAFDTKDNRTLPNDSRKSVSTYCMTKRRKLVWHVITSSTVEKNSTLLWTRHGKKPALALCKTIIEKLELPATKAKRVVEAKAQGA